MCDVSIIIPSYNEENNVTEAVTQIDDLFSRHGENYEIIVVNDGSKDGTWNVLCDLKSRFTKLIIINLMGNFGQSAAYQAGIDSSSGKYILFFSADLETETKHLLTVKRLLEEGYDLVNTNRVKRWTNGNNAYLSLKSMKSQVANQLIRMVSGVNVQDRGSGTKGMTRTIAENIRFYTDMHRFIPDYASVYGARIKEIDVEFFDRQSGQSAYLGQSRLLKVLLDLMTLTFMLKFARKPFRASPGRLLGLSGMVLFLLGSIGFSYLILQKLTGQNIGNRPLLTISVMFIIVGFQSVILGSLGELLMRVYFESSDRKTYVIREKR